MFGKKTKNRNNKFNTSRIEAIFFKKFNEIKKEIRQRTSPGITAWVNW
jgi:hypothetical protein